MLVATKRTQPTMLDFTKAMVATHHDLSKESVALLYAQFAAETANGYHCYNFNYGNAKWSQGSGLDHMALIGVWECFAAAKAQALIESGQGVADPKAAEHRCADGCESVVFSKENPITWFLAYPDAETGMRAFVSMKAAGRFSTAWPFVLAGDVAGFAEDLGTVKLRPGDKPREQGGIGPTAYYTASIAAYTKAMQDRFDAFMKSDAWDLAWAAVAPGSHVPSVPIELVAEGCIAVDAVTGECAAFVSLVDFDIIRAPYDFSADLPPPREVE